MRVPSAAGVAAGARTYASSGASIAPSADEQVSRLPLTSAIARK